MHCVRADHAPGRQAKRLAECYGRDFAAVADGPRCLRKVEVILAGGGSPQAFSTSAVIVVSLPTAPSLRFNPVGPAFAT